MKYMKVTYSVLYALPEPQEEQKRFLRAINDFDPNRVHAWRDASAIGGSKFVESTLVLDNAQLDIYLERIRTKKYTNW